jgi:hypothetical protein
MSGDWPARSGGERTRFPGPGGFQPRGVSARTEQALTIGPSPPPAPHTVTSDDKKFKSRALDTGERFSYTFSAPGTNSYFCSLHPHMTGKIIVR